MQALIHHQDGDLPVCLQQLREADFLLDFAGWRLAGPNPRPTWQNIADGQRPPQPEVGEADFGEWPHGWQYHGSQALEKQEFQEL